MFQPVTFLSASLTPSKCAVAVDFAQEFDAASNSLYGQVSGDQLKLRSVLGNKCAGHHNLKMVKIRKIGVMFK
jgi:hypothetical protein